MDWHEYDEELIRRGELILDLGFVEGYHEELEEMNRGKVGAPYQLTDAYIRLLEAVRYLYRMPYRQLEGFTRGLHRLVPELPSADYSGIRRRILELEENLDPYKHLKDKDESVAVAIDATGVSVHRAGGWVERKHGKKKRYVKLSFAVDVEDKEVLGMEASTDDAHDSNHFPGLVEEAEKHRTVNEGLTDGAYDSGQFYRKLSQRGITPVIKPRDNSVPDTKPKARREVVREYLELGYEEWAEEKGYGRRWMAETAFSTFKRLFGEHALAHTLENIIHELVGKVALYNKIQNL